MSLTGCDWHGLNSLKLPGTAGGGPGSYTIQAQLPDVVNIQENTRVRVDDVTVGNVTKVEVQEWHALVTMRIDGDVRLPANATAKLGQTSLLGSMHIELAPPKDAPPVGHWSTDRSSRCRMPACIPPPSRPWPRCRCCSTVGDWVSLQEITQAVAKAFAGRENDMRSLLHQLDEFIAGTNAQTDDIIAAAENLNALTGQFAAKDQVVDRAVTTVPKALAVLAQERAAIADAIDQLGKFSAIAADTVRQSKQSLVENLRNIAPVLRRLADAGPSLTKGLDGLATYPWPTSTVRNWFRGDYANLTMIVDLTLSRIDTGIFTGSRWEGNLTQLELQWGRTIGMQPSPATAGNPLTFPYHDGGY
ncbi:mammalian cell entry protein [Mycobacterium kiyosense]|nr:mammalian cell entry protein [Mycobacterium kiyosense]